MQAGRAFACMRPRNGDALRQHPFFNLFFLIRDARDLGAAPYTLVGFFLRFARIIQLHTGGRKAVRPCIGTCHVHAVNDKMYLAGGLSH